MDKKIGRIHGLVERASWGEWNMSMRIVPKKEKKNMSQFERFVTEVNETADGLAKQALSNHTQ